MENKTNILSDRIFTKPANNSIHMPIDFGVLKTSDKENKTAHWTLEDGDLDCAYCSKCGYAASTDTNFKFYLDENNDIVVEYPNKCPKCGCEINDFHATGHCFDIIKENLMKKV